MRRTYTCVLVFVAVAVAAGTARADDITDWNQTMLRAGLLGGSSPLAMTRISAIVQAAVFDAVNGIDRRYSPIHVAPAGPAGASQRAAAVQAAYAALLKLYPTQQAALDARRSVSMTSSGPRKAPVQSPAASRGGKTSPARSGRGA